MNLEITQKNLYLLLPSKVAWVADMLSEDKNVSIVEAVKEVYSSSFYKKLEDESTKLWHLGPVAIYQEMEVTNGDVTTPQTETPLNPRTN